MERAIAAAGTRAGADSAGLQTLLLLLALQDQAGPLGIDQEMGYGGKIQLVVVITKYCVLRLRSQSHQLISCESLCA